MKKKLFFPALLMLLNSYALVAQTDINQSYQFLAKIFTEALGRIPDPQSWNDALNYMGNNLTYYRETLRPIYKSSEFYDLYPTTSNQWKEARLLALYRGALNREPDLVGFNSNLNNFSDNQTWAQLVDAVTTSAEFNGLVNDSIIVKANKGIPYYGWKYTSTGGTNYRPIEIVTPTTNSRASKTDFNGTRQELQRVLNRVGNTATANNPDSVCISAMARIYIDSLLIIPANVTLTTKGSPSHFKYAKMARLVKQQLLNNVGHDMIALSANSILKNLWIDGQYPFVGKETGDAACVTNLNTDQSTNGLKILNNRLSDASGPNFIKLYSGNGIGMRNFTGIAEISNNLITAYGTKHWAGGDPWTHTEGIDVDLMENGKIEFNQIVDITDGAICIFQSTYSVSGNYNTLVNGNQVLNAGNSAVAGIVFDQQNNNVTYSSTYSYSGANIQYNSIWTSPLAHIDYLFHIGCYSEYLDKSHQDVATGGNIHHNSTGISSINAEVGILLDGVSGSDFHDNSLSFRSTQAYHSRIDRPFAKIPSTSSTSSPSGTSQYSFESFQVDPYLSSGNRDKYGYIAGPDTVYNSTYIFAFGNFNDYRPSEFNWEIHNMSNQKLAGPYTSSNDYYLIPFNFSSTQWLKIRFYNENHSTDWRTKYVYYINALPKMKSNGINTSSEIPREYKLFQNYPNPFNPVTRISYSIAESGFVTLKVFDILGREVSTLVNEVKPAGKFVVEFNASELPTGTYIYRLTAGNYQTINKMLLLK